MTAAWRSTLSTASTARRWRCGAALLGPAPSLPLACFGCPTQTSTQTCTHARTQTHAHANTRTAQDAVRGDHGEVVALLSSQGGRVMSKEGQLIDLSDSHLSGNVRIFGELDPEWEVGGRGDGG